MKNYKALFLVAVGLASLIAFLWAFKERTDLERYRQLLIREVETATGARPTIGRLSLSLYPKITVHGYDLSLSGLRGFASRTSVSVPHIEMRIRFLSFLRKSLKPYRIILNAPVFTVQRLSSQTGGGREKAEDRPDPPGAGAPKPANGESIPALTKTLALNGYTWSGLESVELRMSDGSLFLSSREGEPPVRVDHITLNSVFESRKRPAPFKGHFRLYGSEVTLSGTVGPLSEQPILSFPAFRAILKSADFRPALVLPNFGWPRIAVLDHRPVSLTLDLSGSPGNPISLEAGAEWTSDASPFLRLIEARCRADYDPLKDVLLLKEVTVQPKVGPGRIKADGELRNVTRSPDIDLRIAIPGFRAYELLVRAGMVSGPADVRYKAFDQVRLDADISGSANDLKVKNGLFQIDHTSCRFSAQLRLNAARSINFDLHVTGLDMDRYLFLPWKRSPSTLGFKRAEAFAALRNGPDSESGIRVSGRVFLEEGLVGGFRFSALKTTLNGESGRYELDPFGFQCYGGSARAKATMETSPDVRRLEMDGTLLGIRTSDLSRDLTGIEQIQGLARMGIQLTGVAPRFEDLVNRIEGRAWVRMKHGALVGPDLLAGVRFVEHQILGSNTAPRMKIPFSRLEGSFRILNGRFHSEDLFMEGPVLTVAGKGSFGLDQTLDMTITPTLLASARDADSTSKDFSLPLRVTGTFTDATIMPDFGRLNFGDAMRMLKQFFVGPGPASVQ
ncbi:MAG: hypothetical protein HY788_09285 [Deltaproteobacteria bacterium]|nr:hypothetical protein [Deltaproteobacteria bacterium]